LVTSINVRNYSEGDEEQIVELFQVAFNGWPRFDLESNPLDYWRWKYGRGYGKDIVVAEADGKIVGAFHSVPCKFKLNNGNYNATLGADIAVSPDYQGMGLYSKMRELVDQTRKKHGVDLHYAINENLKLIEKRRKDQKNNPDVYQRFRHKLTRYIRIKDIDRYLDENPVENQLVKKIGYKVLKRLSESTIANKVRDQHYDVIKVNEYEEYLEAYWNQYKDNYSFIFNKDEEYLRWRYFDNRSSRYEAIALWADQKCMGYCIMKINTSKDARQGYITELLAPNQNAADQLIRHSLDYFDECDVNLVLTLAFSKHPHVQCYKSNGFIPYNTYSIDITLYNSIPSFQRELGKIRVDEAYFSYGDLDYV
jgi:GNAT superfamily N-acetyltransferase